jgi:hypothetical protein
MGGKAIKKVLISRINLENYNKIKLEILEKFNSFVELDFPHEIPNKTSFGDLDVLYKLKNNQTQIIQLIKQFYNPEEIVSNGDVISFSYKLDNEYYQVDFIKCKNISMGKFYFSYGDTGAIIGRISKHYGLTFGTEGLWLSLYSQTVNQYIEKKSDLNHNDNYFNNLKSISLDTTWNLGDIVLSSNPESICTFFGLNYIVWTTGFDSVNKIFDWIKQSKYFYPDIFKSLNSVHRKRANLRPFYQEFVLSILGHTEFTNTPESEISDNRQLFSLEYFNKTNELEILLNRYIINQKRKEKFNGNLILHLGLVNKQEELGKFIISFKSNIKLKYNMDFESWIDSNEKDKVIEEINLHSQNIKN